MNDRTFQGMAAQVYTSSNIESLALEPSILVPLTIHACTHARTNTRTSRHVTLAHTSTFTSLHVEVHAAQNGERDQLRVRFVSFTASNPCDGGEGVSSDKVLDESCLIRK